jgi:hypothetical protein
VTNNDDEPPILTRAESEIMAILWNKDGATVHEVVAALPRSISYTSVLTLLRILEKKGHVRHEAHPDGGRAHLDKPATPAASSNWSQSCPLCLSPASFPCHLSRTRVIRQ